MVRGLSLRTLGAKAHLDGHLCKVGVLVAVAVIGRPDAERMVAVPPADERIPWSPSPN
jgi:hypothetical protein